MNNTKKNEAILQRVDLPIAQATGLPNEQYISEEAFNQDRDFVMGSGWACIGFSDQLSHSNSILPVDFMGLPLLITRDAQDQIRVFHNVCSHRGMKLADAACTNNGAIKCPYHSWTYAMSGELRATPNLGGYGEHSHADFDKAAHGLKEVRSCVWMQSIFINLSGAAPDFNEYIKPITLSWSQFIQPSALDNFVLSENESHLSLTVKSNWKLAVENYLEAYHLPTVHPELNKVSPLDQHYYLDTFDNGAGQGSLNYSRTTVSGTSLPRVRNWPGNKANQAEYPALYPNTFLGIHADQLFIQYLQPLNNGLTAEHVRIFYVSNEACEPQYREHRRKIRDGWQSVFEEDIFAVEGMQAGRQSPGYRGGAFSPVMDAPTHHFHKWVARRMVQGTA